MESAGGLSVLEEPAPELAPEILARVDELWQEARAGARGTLGNGKIFSVRRRSGQVFSGWFAEYRMWVAQRRDPGLLKPLHIRPLAVTGILRSSGGIVLGKRAGTTMQDAGLWELAPSGSITPQARSTGRRIDPRVQLLIELQEEIAVPARSVGSPSAAVVVEDRHSGVCDLVYELPCRIPFEDLEAAFIEGGSGEYSAIRLVSDPALRGFLSTGIETISPVSMAVLDRIAP